MQTWLFDCPLATPDLLVISRAGLLLVSDADITGHHVHICWRHIWNLWLWLPCDFILLQMMVLSQIICDYLAYIFLFRFRPMHLLNWFSMKAVCLYLLLVIHIILLLKYSITAYSTENRTMSKADFGIHLGGHLPFCFSLFLRTDQLFMVVNFIRIHSWSFKFIY